MNKSAKDNGIIAVLLEHFEKQRLPRTLEIKKRVDSGELLSNGDLHFLEGVSHDSKFIEQLVGRYPDWQEFYAKAIHLHGQIVQKALENEKAQKL